MRIVVYGASLNLGGTEKYLLTLYKLLDKNIIQFDFLLSHDVEEIPYEQEILAEGGGIYKEYFKLGKKRNRIYFGKRIV